MKKKCPKCKGKGCSHCGGTGYHEGMNMGGMMKKKKGYAQGGLKMPGADDVGLKKLPTAVRNKMGYMSKGGMMKKGYAHGGLACGASNPAERPMKKGK